VARQSIFSIRVNVSELEGYADFLRTLTPDALAVKWVNAINSTVDSAYELSRRTMLSGINLTEAYVQQKMRVEYATAQRPVGQIIAATGKGYNTGLSHYGRMQLTQAVNWSNARIQAAGHKFGKWPGWTRRTGHAALGIGVDQKASGQSVEVVKGRRKRMGPTFALPGKVDSEGNPVIFRRTGDASANKKGKIESLQGPSVYQLFRVAIPKVQDDAADDLRDAVIYEATRLFGGK
jgi:hypothetical protein